MSDTDQLTVMQLHEDVEKEFLTAIQLIHTISFELEQLKHATNPGSDLEANIIQNAELMNKLIQMKQLSLTSLIDESTFPSNQDMSQEDQNLDESEGL